MEGQLKNGAILTSESGNKYTVVNLLGAGGQGEVYDVECDGKHYALNGISREVLQHDKRSCLKRLLQRERRIVRFSGRWN